MAVPNAYYKPVQSLAVKPVKPGVAGVRRARPPPSAAMEARLPGTQRAPAAPTPPLAVGM